MRQAHHGRTGHLAFWANARWAGPFLSQWAYVTLIFCVQNDHCLANNGLKGKKWPVWRTQLKKMGQCVRNARTDFWSQSAPEV